MEHFTAVFTWHYKKYHFCASNITFGVSTEMKYFNCYPSRAFKASTLLTLQTFCEAFQDTWPTCKQISRCSSFRCSAQLLHAMLVIAIQRAILSLCQTWTVCKVTEVNLELISLYIHVLHLNESKLLQAFLYSSQYKMHTWMVLSKACQFNYFQSSLVPYCTCLQRLQGCWW
jgi:hypothetical protein